MTGVIEAPGMLAKQQLGEQPTAAHCCEHGAGQWSGFAFVCGGAKMMKKHHVK